MNVLAPVMTAPGGPAWAQTIYHPFALTSRHGRGTALRVAAQGETLATPEAGDIPCLTAAAVWDEDAGELKLFLVNRDPERELQVTADLSAFGPVSPVEALVLHDDDPAAANTAAEPDRVTPLVLERVQTGGGQLTAQLPAMSWSTVRLQAY